MRRDAPPGIDDEGNVGLAIFVQRRGHTNDHGIDIFDSGEISRRGEPAGLQHLRNSFCRDVFDITLAGVDRIDLRLINIETHYRKTRPGKLNCQRQPYIAHPNNAYGGGLFHEATATTADRVPQADSNLRAISAPISSDAVAAGDGALKTWMELGPFTIRKSSTNLPSEARAWARTPEGAGTKSSPRTSGTSCCKLRTNAFFRNDR